MYVCRAPWVCVGVCERAPRSACGCMHLCVQPTHLCAWAMLCAHTRVHSSVQRICVCTALQACTYVRGRARCRGQPRGSPRSRACAGLSPGHVCVCVFAHSALCVRVLPGAGCPVLRRAVPAAGMGPPSPERVGVPEMPPWLCRAPGCPAIPAGSGNTAAPVPSGLGPGDGGGQAINRGGLCTAALTRWRRQQSD